jgi:hemoglobin/transferrin/lactoferrin receptor protein
MLFHRPLVLALSLACAGPLPLLPASAHAQAASVTSIFLRNRWPAR